MSTPTPASAYSPGYVTPHRPVYNAYTGKWDYFCSFSHWRSTAKIFWKCNLHERVVGGDGFLQDYVVAPHSGSWTPPPSTHKSAIYHKALQVGQGQYCVEAFGFNVDGGVTRYACN